MGTLANREDQDEMPHNVAFHQGLHCLTRQNQSSEKEIQYFFEIITRDPTVYTMDNPKLIACNKAFYTIIHSVAYHYFIFLFFEL